MTSQAWTEFPEKVWCECRYRKSLGGVLFVVEVANHSSTTSARYVLLYGCSEHGSKALVLPLQIFLDGGSEHITPNKRIAEVSTLPERLHFVSPRY